MSTHNHTPCIWVLHPKSSDFRKRKEVVDILQNFQIDYCEEKPEQENTAVLLILDDTSIQVFDHTIIEDLKTEGYIIFGLYTGAKALPFHRCWELLSMGIEDIIPLSGKKKLGEIIQAKLKRWSIIERILNTPAVKEKLIGNSPLWKKTLRQVVELACFSTAPVLIMGESGSGKELVSRLIHELDKRPDKQDLILLDCSSVVPELSGSEFFGHEKGAFTNAVSSRDGAFALADRGTLFLDEIGELPKNLQAELLRVSQEGSYKRVGSHSWKNTQFRLVSATNRNLYEDVQNGKFRQDLFYRISTAIIQLPPLKERQEDILLLADFFLKQILKTNTPPKFDPQVQHYLITRPYPGNVRELKQVITRLAYRHCGKHPISIGAVPYCDRNKVCYTKDDWKNNHFKNAIQKALINGIGLKDIKRAIGDMTIEVAIEDAAGNLQKAASQLGVSDRLVQNYLSDKKNL